jgi:hypothetical protein
MNTGVVLMNHRVWERVYSAVGGFLNYIWRMLVWLARYGDRSIISEARIQPVIEQTSHMMEAVDYVDALAYPSSSGWIIDEIAMLLTLGGFKEFTYGLFDRRHVLQGYEFVNLRRENLISSGGVICHYYSKNFSAFRRWTIENVAGENRSSC